MDPEEDETRNNSKQDPRLPIKDRNQVPEVKAVQMFIKIFVRVEGMGNREVRYRLKTGKSDPGNAEVLARRKNENKGKWQLCNRSLYTAKSGERKEEEIRKHGNRLKHPVVLAKEHSSDGKALR